ncbi:hypothetical protein M6B38_124180 [Iris pallida]|uniref:Uncharacterized protein n=1 Tax=Iris pallida TaxID=29817 RepID=A0AAX6H2U5_IRIPA|nr:hypothetical protein M6B38_124180 [Iris pallida]
MPFLTVPLAHQMTPGGDLLTASLSIGSFHQDSLLNFNVIPGVDLPTIGGKNVCKEIFFFSDWMQVMSLISLLVDFFQLIYVF